MKNRALIVFLFISMFSFSGLSQFELPDLLRLSKMNPADFEFYVLQKGYDFKKTITYDKNKFVHYRKFNKVNRRYICMKELSSLDMDVRKCLNYQSSSNKDFINLKEYVESNGYELISENKAEFDDRNGMSMVYKKGDIELWFVHWDDWFELNIHENSSQISGLKK